MLSIEEGFGIVAHVDLVEAFSKMFATRTTYTAVLPDHRLLTPSLVPVGALEHTGGGDSARFEFTQQGVVGGGVRKATRR